MKTPILSFSAASRTDRVSSPTLIAKSKGFRHRKIEGKLNEAETRRTNCNLISQIHNVTKTKIFRVSWGYPKAVPRSHAIKLDPAFFSLPVVKFERSPKALVEFFAANFQQLGLSRIVKVDQINALKPKVIETPVELIVEIGYRHTMLTNDIIGGNYTRFNEILL